MAGRTTESGTRYADQRYNYDDQYRDFETEHPRDGRDNGYDAANQHLVKFEKILWEIDERAALGFERNSNPAEHSPAERMQLVEAHAAAFSRIQWNGDDEREKAAGDITQMTFQPLYQRVLIAEAAAEHRNGIGFLSGLQNDDERMARESGDASLDGDINGAINLLRQAEQAGCQVSASHLDRFQERFSDRLYLTGYGENAVIDTNGMHESLENAVSYYNGDIRSAGEQGAMIYGFDSAGWESREGDAAQAGNLAAAEGNAALFRSLEAMDEIGLNEKAQELIEQQMSHTAEFVGELAAEGHPNYEPVANIHEAFSRMINEQLTRSVENGDAARFSAIAGMTESANRELADEIRANQGFVEAEGFNGLTNHREWHGDREWFRGIGQAREYLDEVREASELYREDMSQMNHSIIENLSERMEQEIRILEERAENGLSAGPGDFQQINSLSATLDYMMRPADAEFWELRDAGTQDMTEMVLDLVDEGLKPLEELAHEPDGTIRDPSAEAAYEASRRRAMEQIYNAALFGDRDEYRKGVEFLQKDSQEQFQEMKDAGFAENCTCLAVLGGNSGHYRYCAAYSG